MLGSRAQRDGPPSISYHPAVGKRWRKKQHVVAAPLVPAHQLNSTRPGIRLEHRTLETTQRRHGELGRNRYGVMISSPIATNFSVSANSYAPASTISGSDHTAVRCVSQPMPRAQSNVTTRRHMEDALCAIGFQAGSLGRHRASRGCLRRSQSGRSPSAPSART